MEYLSENDIFYINSATVLTDFDRTILCDLYQPIVGSIGISLFFTLWSKVGSNSTLSSLLSIMQINTSQLLDARKRLEAIGLLKTYILKNEDAQSFLFILFSPKQPRDFFNDEIFMLLLMKNVVNKDEIDKLRIKYSDDISCLIEEFKKQGYEEISAHFKDVYSPDIYSSKYVPSKVRNVKRRRTGTMILDFDIGVFLKECYDNAFIREDYFSDDEIMMIKKVALVYGIDEKYMAESVINRLDNDLPKGSRIDFEGLVKDLNNWSHNDFVKRPKQNASPKTENLNKLIKLMDETSPIKFLMLHQNGGNIASSDANLLNRLSFDFGLNNGVTNALISYVLKVKNNTLPSAYTEKIASSLKREGVTNAYETMNYFNKAHSNMKKKNDVEKNVEDDEFSTPQYDLSSLDE